MIHLLILLVVLGLVIYLVTALLPLDPAIKTVIRVVGLVVALLLVADYFGVLDGYDYHPHRVLHAP